MGESGLCANSPNQLGLSLGIIPWWGLISEYSISEYSIQIRRLALKVASLFVLEKMEISWEK